MIKNIITTIVNRLSSSDNATLSRIGQMIIINYEMATNRENFITASYDYGSSNRMSNILMEMKHLMCGGYYGNKEYLFGRMNYLIQQGFNHQFAAMRPTISVNNIPLEELNITRKPVRARNKKGQFVARHSTNRHKKK